MKDLIQKAYSEDSEALFLKIFGGLAFFRGGGPEIQSHFSGAHHQRVSLFQFHLC